MSAEVWEENPRGTSTKGPNHARRGRQAHRGSALPRPPRQSTAEAAGMSQNGKPAPLLRDQERTKGQWRPLAIHWPVLIGAV